MALPTNGRVIVDTTAGEIDIELWAKETPKTCRNFLALAMEGYYDGVIFHRIVQGFLVQTGDRTGTGAGGESFYGEPFEDEVHPRLRFQHRGLVAMANNGTKNSNDSQFFITLDRADELHGKHTLFGRVMGDTIYNVMKIGEMEIGENERPVYPPKIKSIRVVENPFDDIVPRITAAEKRVQQRAREEAQRAREELERRKGAKKNVKLLSFGADEDMAETDETFQFEKRAIARPDLVEDSSLSTAIPDFLSAPSKSASRKQRPDPVASKIASNDTVEASRKQPEKASKNKDKVEVEGEVNITKLREKHAAQQASSSASRQIEIAKMETEIRKLTRRHGGGDESSDDEHAKKKAKSKSYLEEELAKYSKGRGLQKKNKDGRRKDEADVLAALNSFRGKLQRHSDAYPTDEPNSTVDKLSPGNDAGLATEAPAIEVDKDTAFMRHALHFPKDDGEESRKAERDYEVIDPRQRSAIAKEEERERKRAMGKGREGRPYARR